MGKGLAFAIIAMFMLGFAAVFIGLLFLIGRLIENHHLANKYRELLVLAEQQKQSSGWKVTYRDGKRTKSARVGGATEADAVRNLIQLGIDPRSVISLER